MTRQHFDENKVMLLDDESPKAGSQIEVITMNNPAVCRSFSPSQKVKRKHQLNKVKILRMFFLWKKTFSRNAFFFGIEQGGGGGVKLPKDVDNFCR